MNAATAANAQSHLASDRVNLLELKDWLRREFLSFFEDATGKKTIIWDNQLTQPLGLIADYKVLKERGVDKMMDLRQLSPLKSRDVQDMSHLFFIVKPRLELMQLIADHVHSLESDSKSEPKECHIIFVPRKSHICEKKLKELGVYGTFKENLKEFFLDLIPLDYDLLSMENPEIYRDLFLFNDSTYLFHIAKSIMTLQTLYGIIPNIYGKGKFAKMVADQIVRMRKELTQNQEPQVNSKIDNLIIIDRSMDYITPMMVQLTYEGLVDENFNIKYTQLEMPQDRSKTTAAPAGAAGGGQDGQAAKVNVVEMKKTIAILNSADSLFAELRDRNFYSVNHVLSRTAKELQQANEAKNRLDSVSKIRQFVEKELRAFQAKKQSLENHMTLAEIIKEVTSQDEFIDKLRCQSELLAGLFTDKPCTYIMAAMCQGEELDKILRLICIHSVVNNGFKPPLLETYKRELIRAYGFSHFGLVQNIEKAGLIFAQGQKSFNQISQKLNLLVENVSEDNPNDIAYVFSGYAPLSVRFCQYLTRMNWKSLSEVFGLLPGNFVEETQKLPAGVRKRRNSNTSINSAQSTQSVDQKMTLVYFIGGCTYAEISAFRYLSESNDSPSEFIVATTCITNGKNLLATLQDSTETNK